MNTRLAVCLAVLWVPAGALAQSPMGQGQASITTRANVTLSLDSDRNTPNSRLQSLGVVVLPKIADIRGCYERVVAQRPTAVGTMRIRLVVPLEGDATVEVTLDQIDDEPLERCALRAIRSARLQDAERPAAAILVLTFTNSAAEGVAAVQANAGTTPEALAADARGATSSGEVTWQVSPDGAAPEAAASPNAGAIGRALRVRVPGLLDCRRRAGRRGASPLGELQFTVDVRGTRITRVTAGPSTVADSGAPQCAQRVLNGLELSQTVEGTRFRVVVRYVASQPTAPAP